MICSTSSLRGHFLLGFAGVRNEKLIESTLASGDFRDGSSFGVRAKSTAKIKVTKVMGGSGKSNPVSSLRFSLAKIYSPFGDKVG